MNKKSESSKPDNEQLPQVVFSGRKILVSGEYSAGKTTLCRALREDMEKAGTTLEIVGEIPRRCPYALNRRQTHLATGWLFGEQIKSEVEACAANVDIVICDRGLPDYFSHTRTIAPNNKNEETLFRTLKDIAQGWSQTYDLVFWARHDPSAGISGEGVRVVDKSYQKLMQESIRATFSELGLVARELPPSTEERVAFIMHAMEEMQ